MYIAVPVKGAILMLGDRLLPLVRPLVDIKYVALRTS
jgi:hypothetical protein